MGGDWQQRHVQTRDVRAYGSAARYEDIRLGIEFRETNHDKIRREEHPRAAGAQSGLEFRGE